MLKKLEIGGAKVLIVRPDLTPEDTIKRTNEIKKQLVIYERSKNEKSI